MKIKFKNTFFNSIKKLVYVDTFWYKTYSFIRYGIIRFIRNIWSFRKELYEYHRWDWRYQLMMMRRGFELEVKYITKYGHEIEISKDKKIEKMKRLIEISKWHEDDLFLELAEKELGYKYIIGKFEFKEEDQSKLNQEITKGQKYYELIDNSSKEDKEKNKKLTILSDKIQVDSFNELLSILKGQDFKKFDTNIDWYKQFDGSGIQNWWD